MSASHDARAATLAASVPEKSRDPEIQRARLKAEELYELVARTSGHTKATQTIAGMLREFALEYWEKEKAHILQEAKARTLGEVAALRRAIAETEERLAKIAQQSSF